ncbi:rho GTPase-activating protein 18-like [Sycon ciliatum]|uniref:rho GTPase-activating protein 18-like n=1 Tax=Sycon ciliatum TaxID=27933 RepID=UPI0031F66F92
MSGNADITLVRSTPPGAATALAEVHHNVLSPKGRSGKRVNGSLNLECYWEEAKRIEQESPGIAEKPTSEYEDPKEDRETDPEADGTPEPGRKDARPASVLSLSEAVTVVKHVALLSAMVRKRRHALARASLQEDAPGDSEVISPLRTSCDCAHHYADHSDPHPGDPRDNDYLVLQYGEDGRTDESQPLPEYRLRFQPTGVSYMDDLSVPDRDKIRHIALLELTSLFDRHSLPLRVSRPPKRKATTSESKVLGVPLTTLLERDQERIPTAKCPVFMEEICNFLDENALKDEGILRIPGNSARLKRLREELEKGYDEGTFSWAGRRTNDAATLLKQYLRELPIPLLTHEYLRAFATAEAIPNRRDQIGALNLLILLLPDGHRETLMVLLRQLRRITEFEEFNKMGLSNVAMIIAPNLFCQLGKMSRNADSEVKLAAGTSQVVRILIFYWQVLFVVPNVLISHLRDLNEAEASQTRKAKNYKDVKKVLTAQKNKSLSVSRCTELPSPVVGKVSKSNHYVIKVLSPEFPRISMILEINNHSRVCEVLTNFRRKQMGLMSPSHGSQTVDDCSSINALDLSMGKTNHKQLLGSIGEDGSSPSSPSSMGIDHLCVKSSTSSLQDTYTSRRHSSPVNNSANGRVITNEDMYECDGNIGSRRLREGALVMEILKENPGTRFFVRKRFPSPDGAPLSVC